MQMGYNTDVDHHGVTVHIQTEDHGLGDSKITTQVFFSGRILDSRTISYAEAISGIGEDDARDQEITKRMRAIHRHFLNRIREGTYDTKLPIAAPLAAAVETAAPIKPSLTRELDAIAADELLQEELAQAEGADIFASGSDDLDIDLILQFENKTWRGIDYDYNAALGDALRAALVA